jgi:hypothetical protein
LTILGLQQGQIVSLLDGISPEHIGRSIQQLAFPIVDPTKVQLEFLARLRQI